MLVHCIPFCTLNVVYKIYWPRNLRLSVNIVMIVCVGESCMANRTAQVREAGSKEATVSECLGYF